MVDIAWTYESGEYPTSVSDTHLDVYKRQGGETFVKRIAGLPGDKVEINGAGSRVVVNGVQVRENYVTLTAVSYTHLDVYKRQAVFLAYREDSEEYVGQAAVKIKLTLLE